MLGNGPRLRFLRQVFSLDTISYNDNHVLLTLSCKDSENELVQVATAIVQKPDTDGYRYLLRNCKRHPEMREFITSPETTCFAGNRRAPVALATEAPRVQQRWSLDHILCTMPPTSAVRISVTGRVLYIMIDFYSF